MAMTNSDRVGKAVDLLRQGLAPFVERELTKAATADPETLASALAGEDAMLKNRPIAQWDASALLIVMWKTWNHVFKNILGHAERSLVSELREVRNRWAHQQPFSSDDAYRAMDSIARLLNAVSAPQETAELERMKMELLRLRFDEQARQERRKTAGTTVESEATGTLRPWREIVTPHRDVASGRYQQAEFAADLWQVHMDEGSSEYRDPEEFFRRTFLTESLKQLLMNAVRRLGGQAGDPVVQLQTNFGGGKTHSMLALFHLFSGILPTTLPGVEPLLDEVGMSQLPTVRRVVLVGNKISPGRPETKPDGTVVRTLWGELAWQLGGAAAFARIREDDERATSPGDALRELFNEYGPCLVLIDEWVAYARQLHDDPDLPGGSFETHFTFAQALTESAKLAKHCLLVISVPASDTTISPHAQANDVEVGGPRGREALDRLRHAIGRVDAPWKPASPEEGFEIVRRRLFEPLSDPELFKQRDVVARAFHEYYASQHQEFPAECRDSDYERRIKSAYPIHPEVFDRLYTDWSTLVKFQRTRGVLRLMAAVIHSLWDKGDRNPLIMPCSIPIDDPRVQFELTRYLPDNWTPVIERDVDGPNALPLRLDNELPNLGRYHAARRVARTVYLGSAPITKAANQGIDDRRIKLGCVLPGESPAVFGDAMRRLATSATYLYQDGSRYWYSTQPTVTKLAEDRAEQLKRTPDRVAAEIDRRLRADLRNAGDFKRVHPLPQSGADVPDDYDARLVVLGLEHPYTRDSDNPALTAAKTILESRGNAPRLCRNTLVFLAADHTRAQDLDEAVRSYLAWESILLEKETLDLSPHQVRQAETQKRTAEGIATARLPEVFQWLLVPTQRSPQDTEIQWDVFKLNGQDSLAVRVSKRLKSEELLVLSLGGTRLLMELDRVPLWQGNHIKIETLTKYFACHPYLPRLQSPRVLIEAILNGLSLPTWSTETFAYAESYDETENRYKGLRCGQAVSIDENDTGMLVQSTVASQQQQEECPVSRPSVSPKSTSGEATKPVETGNVVPTPSGVQTPELEPKRALKRFHGTVVLDPARVGRDAGRIADEVISHLVGLLGANVTVTLEIEAEMPKGAPEQVVRTVTENSMTLRFRSHGFEEE